MQAIIHDTINTISYFAGNKRQLSCLNSLLKCPETASVKHLEKYIEKCTVTTHIYEQYQDTYIKI